jgi:HK97 gp10 family phage protein
MPINANLTLGGLAPLTTRLESLRKGAQNKILRPAVLDGAKVFRDGLKDSAPVMSITSAGKKGQGILKQSMVATVSTKGGVVVGRAGPNKDVKIPVLENGQQKFRVVTRTARKTGVKYQQRKYLWIKPSRYAHVVEHGHGGKHPAPPHPFMRPTYDGRKAEATQAVADRAEIELAKLAKGA